MVMGQQGFLGFMFKTEWNDEVHSGFCEVFSNGRQDITLRIGDLC